MPTKEEKLKWVNDNIDLLRHDMQVDGVAETLLLGMNKGMNDFIIGSVRLRIPRGKPAGISWLFVAEGCRRCGVATWLLEACKKLATEAECPSVGLEVAADNAGVRDMYAALGYVPVMIYGDGTTVMTLVLERERSATS